eukprot:6128600-Prymnesium_polylepis.1
MEAIPSQRPVPFKKGSRVDGPNMAYDKKRKPAPIDVVFTSPSVPTRVAPSAEPPPNAKSMMNMKMRPSAHASQEIARAGSSRYPLAIPVSRFGSRARTGGFGDTVLLFEEGLEVRNGRVRRDQRDQRNGQHEGKLGHLRQRLPAAAFLLHPLDAWGGVLVEGEDGGDEQQPADNIGGRPAHQVEENATDGGAEHAPHHPRGRERGHCRSLVARGCRVQRPREGADLTECVDATLEEEDGNGDKDNGRAGAHQRQGGSEEAEDAKHEDAAQERP